MTKLESAIEDRLRKVVEAAGGLCIKLPALLYRGIPDRLLILPRGRVVFVELKRSKKAKTKRSVALHQNSWAKTLRTLGHLVIKIEGDDDLDDFIYAYL